VNDSNDCWLTGWKAIAARIGLSERTAKRYYYHFGMPVYKTPTNKPIAIAYELDIWRIEFNKKREKRDEKKQLFQKKNKP